MPRYEYSVYRLHIGQSDTHGAVVGLVHCTDQIHFEDKNIEEGEAEGRGKHGP